MAFQLQGGALCAGPVSLARIAEAVGTPTYVYSADGISAQYRRLEAAFADVPAEICYAVKANSNLGVLRLMNELGAGFDIVSGGELQRVVAAGALPETVVFSGVGKSEAEINLGLKLGIRCFNVESAAELQRIARQAERLHRIAPVALRVNPDVDARTHPYIATGLKENKFGVEAREAAELLVEAERHPWLEASGLACHIGSQVEQVGPYLEALDRLLDLLDQLEASGIELGHIDIGGGFGVTYQDETPFEPRELATAAKARLNGRPQTLVLEPGRFLTANAGVLLTRVEYLKPGRKDSQHSFAVVDAAMNDLLRPALYQSWHRVERVLPAGDDALTACWDIVGPICESGDFLARQRELALAPGDLLAVRSAGAYGMAQSSNYNARGRPAEVLVEGDRFRVVRRREHINDQLALERIDADG
ncbi:MAG: diaminopimelate decarboxylase [Gammaproteobacteria bacterium]|nr:diaminopimelate decarboxylase [Gammaproteobacteria bacterium]MYE50452.1 diaminopimelate decarboxylase [Gammaproteobacteria bacterium]MYH16383.1 diaminopimelate decarboxylase [Gammaproteobacteria bacterium]MYK84120.1 diaminopimelate decarboxylase [Gammaproteobacteria bacterium]